MFVEHNKLDDGIHMLELFNPPVNAWGIENLIELKKCIRRVGDDGNAKVIVLCAPEGKPFNAGGDLKDIESRPGHEGIVGQCSESTEVCQAIVESPVPVIAAIDKYCIGLGIEIIGSCDITVASEAAKFMWKEIDAGTVGGAAQTLRMLPPQLVRHVLFTGHTLTGSDLFKYGAIVEAVPEGRSVNNRAKEIAQQISQKDATVLRFMKASIDGLEKFNPGTAMRYEQGFIYQLNMTDLGSNMRKKVLSGKL